MFGENKRIKGGVITMGSLFWESGRNCLKAIESIRLGKLRTKWRNENLVIADSEQVKLPIRYGKISSSRKNTYTMIFSREYLNEECFGQIIPFKDAIDFYTPGMVEEQTKKMAEAEGIFKENREWLAIDWCVMAIWINPNSTAPIINHLRQEWDNILNTQSYRFRGNSRRETDYSGYNDPVLLNNNFELIDVPIKCNFDFLLLTYTKPDANYPDVETIAEAINCKQSKYNTYLKRNIESKIITSDDKKIRSFLSPSMKF
jgi:hypothetical protein